MHANEQRLNLIKNKVKEIVSKKQLKTNPQIIAVSKTFSMDKIIPLLEIGDNIRTLPRWHPLPKP